MTGLYEIEYKFLDELNEPNWRVSDIVVYDSSEVGFGETLEYAFEKANEDDDFSGVDKLLRKMYDVDDDSVAFYLDLNNIAEGGTSKSTKLVSELQQSHGIIVKDINYIQMEMS